MPFLGPMLGSIAVQLAIGVGAAVLSNMLRPKKKDEPVEARAISFEMAVGEGVPISSVFGVGRARGSLHYLNEYGDGEDYHLQMVIRIGAGHHDGMQAFLIDEKVEPLSGSNADPKGMVVDRFRVDADGNPSGGGTPYMWVKTYTGAAGQVADPELIARSNPVGRWTSASKMTGWAYMIVTIRYHATLFGSVLPKIGSVWRGLRLYDWRNPACIWGDPSTYVFSKNPIVQRFNYRRGIYIGTTRVLGMGFGPFFQDMTYYTAAANVCDESVNHPAAGVTEPRYEFGREILDDEPKLSVMSEFNLAICGSSFKRGGADAPLPAQQLVSLMTLNNSDRLTGHSVIADRKGTVSSKKTMWHGQFVSEADAWSLAPFSPRIDTALEAKIGGRRAQPLDQPFERSQTRAQMRAEIALRRQLYPATRIETFTPKAKALEPGDLVTRVCEWGSILMIVEKTDPLPDGEGVTITFSQWNNAIVPASGESFVTIPPSVGVPPSNPNRTLTVSGLSIIPYSREGGGATHAFGKATWTQITDPNVDQVLIRVWPTAGSEALDKEDYLIDAKLANSFPVGPLRPLTQHTYKATVVRSDGRLPIWTNTGTFTTGVELAPGVAPGGIDIGMLNDLVRSSVDAVLNNSEGSIADRFAELEDRFSRLSGAVGDVGTIHERVSQELRAKTDRANAFIVDTRQVIVTQNEAFATDLRSLGAIFDASSATFSSQIAALASADTAFTGQLQSFTATVNASLASVNSSIAALVSADGSFASQIATLSAQYNGISANGVVGFQLGNAPSGVTARYVVAIIIDGNVIAADIMDIVPNGLGGYKGRKVVLAGEFYILDADGNYVDAPFTVVGGEAVMDLARINTVVAGRLQNVANTTYLDLTTGEFRVST